MTNRTRFERLAVLVFATALAAASIGCDDEGTENGGAVVTAITCGGGHACAVVENAGLMCWGANDYGQLGIGDRTSVQGIIAVPDMSDAYGPSCSYDFSCALVDGGVKCWGDNYFGELGTGNLADKYSPTDVKNLDATIVQVAAGGARACAVTDAGRVWCWGWEDCAQGGYVVDGECTAVDDYWMSGVREVAGLETVASVAVGTRQTCALLQDGSVKCWGGPTAANLCYGEDVAASGVPVAVPGLSGKAVAVAGNDFHFCALIDDGSVWCWGCNENGAVGNGTTDAGLTATAVSSLGGAAIAIAAGTTHTCALLETGGVRCWGANDRGQLGDGTTENRLTPVAVQGLDHGVNGLAAGKGFTCATLSAGGARCWGDNTDGQLGAVVEDFSAVPVEVPL